MITQGAAESRRALPRLDAGPRAHRCPRRDAVASRSRHRSHRAASSATAEDRTDRAAQRRLVLHRHAAAAHPDDDQTGLQGDRHSGRGAPLRDCATHTCCRSIWISSASTRTRITSAKRCRPWPRCLMARAAAAPHPALGLSLAAGLSLHCADRPPARDDDLDAVHVRQFADNVHRPRGPLRPVVYGPESSDEMGDLWLQVLPRSAADASTLVSAFAEREKRGNVTAAELLASVYRERQKSAVPGRQLRGSWPRRRGGASPRTRVATRSAIGERAQLSRRRAALQGRARDAVRHLRQAAALDPRDERLPFNLGNALNAAGQPAEAARAFERAL